MNPVKQEKIENPSGMCLKRTSTVPIYDVTNAKKNKFENDVIQSEPSPESTSKFVDLLEKCPCCWETPRFAPVYNCRSGGHIICNECHPKVKVCPTCRDPDISGRNNFAEQLVRLRPRYEDQ